MNNNIFSVGRLVTRQTLRSPNSSIWRNALIDACKHFEDKPLSVLQTPGGFIRGGFPMKDIVSGPKSNASDFSMITKAAGAFISKEIFSKSVLAALKKTTNYLTLGVDVREATDPNLERKAELVGTYDTRKGRFINWTGKSYPAAGEEESLVYCTNYKSHFQYLGKKRVLILACHDLNMFSPRSRASSAPNTYKAKTSALIQKMCDKFQPEVVLHHPHCTDTTKVWITGWVGVRRWITSAETYASGINYAQYYEVKGKCRQPLETVLRGTASGNVTDYVMPV